MLLLLLPLQLLQLAVGLNKCAKTHALAKFAFANFAETVQNLLLQSLQMQKWANFASFCVKVHGKSFVDFCWQKLRLDLCKLQKLQLAQSALVERIHCMFLSGACILHFPKAKLRILSQDCWLIKSLRVLDSTAKVLEVPLALAWRLLGLLEAPPSPWSPLKPPLQPFKPPSSLPSRS